MVPPRCDGLTDDGRLCVLPVTHRGNHKGTPTTAEILAFEALYLPDGTKQTRILKDLGIPITRYYQLLNNAIGTISALEMNPTLVYRLRSQRDTRMNNRTPKGSNPE